MAQPATRKSKSRKSLASRPARHMNNSHNVAGGSAAFCVSSRAKKRPSWDSYFMKIAEHVSERSTCLRRQTGALIVKDKRILATGYNGAPSGLRHCAEVGCLREQEKISSGKGHELCRGLHAEQNAIIQAALHGIEIKNSKVYTTHQPCVLCAKMITNAGIREIFYRGPYPDSLAEDLLHEAGVKLVQLKT